MNLAKKLSMIALIFLMSLHTYVRVRILNVYDDLPFQDYLSIGCYQRGESCFKFDEYTA